LVKSAVLRRAAVVLAIFFFAASGSALAIDRNAFTFAAYDLHARVLPEEHAFWVTGKITLRNDSPSPQRFAALQISSTLAWDTITAAGKTLAFMSQPYQSDIDHTGALSEAVVTLSTAVPPKGSVDLEVQYSGTIPADTTRLTRIGAPAQMAAHSEWDQISAAFTAVRGVGHVCWYPVSMDAVSLSDGNTVFKAISEFEARVAGSTFRLALETEPGQSIVANGRLVGQQASTPRSVDEEPSKTVDYDFTNLALYPPTFAIANYDVLTRPEITVSYLPGQQLAARDYAVAAEKLVPFITEWLGAPRERTQVVQLADVDAVPFESGTILFTPLKTTDPQALELSLTHQLAHAALQSPRPWIAEGVAHFMQAVRREDQAGRKAAIEYMDQFRQPLADAEQQELASGSPAGIGQPLTRATDDIYYRYKAMFVWWMLRDMIGDEALQKVLQSYVPDKDGEPSYVQRLVRTASKRDLESFFDDWVYRDRGLPDFHIDAAFPRATLPSSFVVTVTVENTGSAGAEVPVIVRTQNGAEVVKRMLVPAHEKAVERIPVPVQPAQAQVNDGSVPESNISNNTATINLPHP
jgi:hypothetical protein